MNTIRLTAATLIFLSVIFAGCLNDAEPHPTGPNSDGLPAAPDEGHPPPQQEPAAAPAEPSNNTSVSPPEWAPPEEATIRPGVQIDGGNCTANFVFTSMNYSELYIGSAAHCFTSGNESDGYCSYLPFKPGTPISIRGASEAGILAYSSFYTMVQNNVTNNREICVYNDFALIKISDADKHKVSPALIHYGGPTSLANSTSLSIGDKILSFGNSTDHHDTGYLQRKEGYVSRVQSNQGWTTDIETFVIFGDSGSAVIDSSGRAVGSVKGITIGADTLNGVGVPGWLITNLDKALAYARENGGIEVRLATWDLLEDGMLPELPP